LDSCAKLTFTISNIKINDAMNVLIIIIILI